MDNQDIDAILEQWPFDPMSINVRLLESRKRRVLQMRVDMGILQLETEGRPDGVDFNGSSTYFEFLQNRAKKHSEQFQLDEEICLEIDREFVQFYHRRVCWLQLKEFNLAVKDADHTLGLMDFCKQYSPDEQWTISHEQYRPFVLYHRTQAAALSHLSGEENDEQPDSVELAIDEVNMGLTRLEELFVEYDAADQFQDDELVQRLIEFRDGLRDRYKIGMTLQEQLEDAIELEEYERAASIRDILEKRSDR
ncbi:MAG: UvrB/UvrC motif-containing protein [Planctomycetota bacterium]